MGVIGEPIAVAEQVAQDAERGAGLDEWPEVYSGNGGVESSGSQYGSISRWM